MENKPIIGVYNDFNPINSMRKERLEALLREARRQDIRLVFFENEDIDFSRKIVDGLYHGSNGFQKIRTAIPEVTINLFPTIEKDKTLVDLKLSKETIYTTNLIDGKMGVYNRIKKAGKFDQHVIPSEKVKSIEDIMSYMEERDQAVLKPTGGRQGQNIYFLYNEDGRIYFQDHEDKREVDARSLKRLIGDKIDRDEYIIQPYIRARTKDDEPYDFRFHVQKDGNNDWVLTIAYPRIGQNYTIITNISKDGRSEDIVEFLKNERPYDWQTTYDKLKKLSLDLAEHINSLYPFELNELGIDLAIDEDDNIWMYEANTGPQTIYDNDPREQTRFHDNLRSKRDLEYANYLREKSINDRLEDQLKLTSMAILDLERDLLTRKDKKLIGVLDSNLRHSSFKLALSSMGKLYGYDFIFFNQTGLEKDKKLVRAFSYEGNYLKSELFAYPDMVYNISDYNPLQDDIFEEFKDIFILADRELKSIDKLDVYRKLSASADLEGHILDYKILEDPDELYDLLDKNHELILKKESSEDRLIEASMDKEELEEIIDSSTPSLSYGDKALTFKTEGEPLIVQEALLSYDGRGRAYSLVGHYIKDGEDWSLIKDFVKLSGPESKSPSTEDGGFMISMDSFLAQEDIGKKDIKQDMKSLTKSFADYLENSFNLKFHRISLEFILVDGDLKLKDIEIDDRSSRFYELEAAEAVVAYIDEIMKSL